MHPLDMADARMMRLSRKQVQIEMKGVAIEPTSVRSPSWSSVCMTLEKR